MVDYRKLRPHNLMSSEFRHLLLLIFWPLYGLAFLAVERLIPMAGYAPVWCPADDLIPFCEWFMIPYILWFALVVGMHVYTLLFDVPAFRRMMYFIMLTYGVTILIYLIWPTCQNLRPAEFPRDNFMTRFIGMFYILDTNTNVCPSIHVIGSMAVTFAAWDTERFRTPLWKTVFLGIALLVSVSTLFVKQHSCVDVVLGMLLSWLAYAVIYVIPKGKK